VDTRLGIVIAVVVVAILLIVFFLLRKKRTETLRSRFGPEYDRTAREVGPRRAESTLREREKRVEKFSIRELSAAEREHFLTKWRVVQSSFMDDPRAAVADADGLVSQLMGTRGYPMADFAQRAADVSVDHPRVVDNYRAAHEIALRQDRGQATTEDLRGALIYYRSLFDELLKTRSTALKKEVA
jgi:hypothetical protein